MKNFLVLLFILVFPPGARSQVELLKRPELLEKIRAELSYTYSTDFGKARATISELEKEIPGNPVLPFMEALLLYWENFPLTPADSLSDTFLRLLDETVSKGELIVENDPENLEGNFFCLFARALSCEYWADNGKPSKVLPYLNTLYRQMLRGMDLKDKFNEFYFTTGLYNYYIEAYPIKHPAYKPIKALFHEGDLQKGLSQLQYCAANSVYVRNEARYFLMHIYLNYENDPGKASEYASGLHKEFPRNPLYAGKYAEILIYSGKYEEAENVVARLKTIPGKFAELEYSLYKGLLDEKYRKNINSAFNEYNRVIQMAHSLGDAASPLKAIAWMGLGRYYDSRNDHSAAQRFYRMAEDNSSYDYIINDRYIQ
jgi:hypothetical protein